MRPHWPPALLALALTLAIAPTASAAGWLSAQTFAAQAPAGAQVALDGQGRMTAVWQDQTASTCNVRAVDHAGSVFSTVKSLSGSVSQHDCQPELAGDAAGDMVAVWTTGANVFASTKTAGGPWSAAVPLDTADSAFSAPQVAINSGGDATVVWVHAPATGPVLHTRRWTPGLGWQAVATIDTGLVGATFSSPAVGVDSFGNARALWEATGATGNSLRTATRTAPGTFGAATDVISATMNTQFQSIQVKPDGAAHWLAAWRDVQGGGQDIGSAFASGSGTFAVDTSQLSGGSQQQVDAPGIGFASNGVATIVWSYFDGTHYSTLVRNRPASSGIDWSTQPAANIVATPSTSAEFASPGSVVVDGAGLISIVYTQGGTVFERDGTALSALASPVNLGSGANAVLDDPSGYRAALWTSSSLVNLRVFDPVPPSVPSLTVPASATAGDQVTVSASATDEWGPVSFQWDFGDGSPAGSGASTTHAYGAAGSFTVTGRALDGAGNSSSATAPITINAATTTGSAGGGGELPPPVAGVSANLTVVSGNVLVKIPGSSRFASLSDAKQLPIGTIVDVLKGRVQVTGADRKGHLATGQAYGGRFVLKQASKDPFVTLVLNGGSFGACQARPHGRKAAAAAKSKKRVRLLWASGKVNTSGKRASAIVRGTKWVTIDRCDGTLVRVVQGVVLVRDLVRKRNVTVKAHHQYLARAPRG